MRTFAQTGVATAAALLLIVSAGCSPRRMPQDEPRASVSPRAIQDQTKPQLAHRLLQPLVGRWTTLTRYRPNVNAPLRVTEGRAEARWILDDLFLLEEALSAATPVSGEYRGMGITGYDPATDSYKTVWLDNQRGDILTGSGNVDPSGRLFTFVGSYNDPVTGRQIYTRRVLTIVSNDSHTFDMFQREGDGPEFKALEVTYTRDRM